MSVCMKFCVFCKILRYSLIIYYFIGYLFYFCRSERETSTPFSPVSMRSPANSLADECGGSPRPQLAHSSSMELELNISLMEMETNNNANKGGNINVPPPPPPPPPPGGGGAPLPVSGNLHQKIAPAPLPTPPNSIDQSPSLSQPILQQFIPPPQKINPQILFAKQQLESPNSKHDSSKPTGPVRAGPKGQFIWPPVSVQSSNSSGTVTIRANRYYLILIYFSEGKKDNENPIFLPKNAQVNKDIILKYSDPVKVKQSVKYILKRPRKLL